MKKNLPLSLTLIVSVGLLINSCTKENLATNEHANSITQTSVIPNVTDCGPGYHWDFNLKKCVPNNCEPGFIGTVHLEGVYLRK